MCKIDERKKLGASLVYQNKEVIMFDMIPTFLQRYPLEDVGMIPLPFDVKKSILYTTEDKDKDFLLSRLLDRCGMDSLIDLGDQCSLVGMAHRYHKSFQFITINIQRNGVTRTEFDKYLQTDQISKFLNPIIPYFNLQMQISPDNTVKKLVLTGIPHLVKFYRENEGILIVDTNSEDGSQYVNISEKYAINHLLPMIIFTPETKTIWKEQKELFSF